MTRPKDTFCIVPFQNLYILPSGHLRSCCAMVEPIRDNDRLMSVYFDSIDEVWGSPHLREIRRRMIHGETVPDCEYCNNHERDGIRSRRQLETQGWVSGWHNPERRTIEEIKQIALNNNFLGDAGPSTLELLPGTTCNLKCRMCGAHSSSSIAADTVHSQWSPAGPLIESDLQERKPAIAEGTPYGRFPNADPWPSQSAFLFGELLGNTERLRSLSIIGGEPMIMKEALEIMRHLVRIGAASRIHLIIVTNATRVSEEWCQLAAGFKSVLATVSVDGYQDVYEYIRYPAHWTDLDTGLLRLKRMPNVRVLVSMTVQAYNMFDVVNLAKYCAQLDLTLQLPMLQYPPYLSAFTMPLLARRKAAGRLREFASREHPRGLESTLIEAAAAWESTPEPSDPGPLREFMVYTNDLDAARNQDFKASLPELHQSLAASGLEWSAETRFAPHPATALSMPAIVDSDALRRSGITTWAMLDLTSKCNLRCVYCYKSLNSGTTREREFDFPMGKLDEVLETLRMRGVGIVGLSGTGETTIFKDWVVVAEKLISMGIHCTITTNFSKLLSSQEAETLAKFGSIQISLETFDPQLFSKIRRGGNLLHIRENMEKVREAARRIDFRPPQWRVTMTINDKVVLHLEETVERCLEWGFEAFTFANMAKDTSLPDLANAMNTYPVTWMPEPDRTEAYRCVERAIRRLEGKGIPVICHDVLREPVRTLLEGTTAGAARPPVEGFGAPPPKSGETRLCTDPWEYVMLGAEGSVFPCCVGNQVVGNFNSLSLEHVLNSEAMIGIRRRLIEGRLAEPCLHCSLKSLVPLGELRDRVLQLKARKPKPILPLPVEELNEVFGSWKRAGKRIVVYPAGNQARWLAMYTSLLKTGVVRAFSDRDPAKIGTTLSGIPIHAPEDIPGFDIQGILIVSDLHEEEIYTSFEHLEARGIKRIRFQSLGIHRAI